MDDIERLTEVERLLLMAAYVQGFTSKYMRNTANTAKVLNRTLQWLGLTAEESHQGIVELEDGERSERSHLVEAVYVLIRMTWQLGPEDSRPWQERPGKHLFDGLGNWGDPGEPDSAAAPRFNACKLTEHGHQLAEQLLGRHPEYRDEPADDTGSGHPHPVTQARRAWLQRLTNDLFGKPRSVAVDPRWLTATVKQLAQSAYDGQVFARLPILADALEEAGCQQQDVLTHLRSGGEHMRGCWALDLVLGRE